jgi:hypothetical protein
MIARHPNAIILKSILLVTKARLTATSSKNFVEAATPILF